MDCGYAGGVAINNSAGPSAAAIADLAVGALLSEVEAGPKPGLVDRFGPGVHLDMDISHFRRSAAALHPWFQAMAAEGQRCLKGNDQPDPFRLVELGLAAEQSMLAATGGVNTHKGAIWTLGLLCCAAGRHAAKAFRQSGQLGPDGKQLCYSAGAIARHLLKTRSPAVPARISNGEQAKITSGARSATDEAAAGFPTIREALDFYHTLQDVPALTSPEVPGQVTEAPGLAAGLFSQKDITTLNLLLACLRSVDDTCVIARGGWSALLWLRAEASAILENGGLAHPASRQRYLELCVWCQDHAISPGGAADLCAGSLFLLRLEPLFLQ